MSTSKKKPGTEPKAQASKTTTKVLTQQQTSIIEQEYQVLTDTLTGSDGLKWCYPPDENCKRFIDSSVVIE